MHQNGSKSQSEGSSPTESRPIHIVLLHFKSTRNSGSHGGLNPIYIHPPRPIHLYILSITALVSHFPHTIYTCPFHISILTRSIMANLRSFILFSFLITLLLLSLSSSEARPLGLHSSKMNPTLPRQRGKEAPRANIKKEVTAGRGRFRPARLSPGGPNPQHH